MALYLVAEPCRIFNRQSTHTPGKLSPDNFGWMDPLTTSGATTWVAQDPLTTSQGGLYKRKTEDNFDRTGPWQLRG